MKPRIVFVSSLSLTLLACVGEQNTQQSTLVEPVQQPIVDSQPMVAEKNARAPVSRADAGVYPGSLPGTYPSTHPRSYPKTHPGAHLQMGFAAPKAVGVPGYPMPSLKRTAPQLEREVYEGLPPNGVRQVAEHPVSTFSVDVDTGAYANVRRYLMQGKLPPTAAVRSEELLNYFSYADPVPNETDKTPFKVSSEISTTPWNPDTRLLRVALKAKGVGSAMAKPANLVFLVDVSGSMHSADKLPLLKQSLRMLVRELGEQDKVSLVVYAGASGVVLEPTGGHKKVKIEQALQQLRAGGSTNGGEGIRLAYAKAKEAFIPGGINRVILATDGDFNVGTVNHEALLDLVEQQRKAGIALTTLGFGQGNYNDHLMEQLADHGDGNHAYIDSLLEARKVLVEERGSTLQTLARDVKIQIEFNPQWVDEYRLIGYENRVLAREDFNNDAVDAGEMGAGHSVVALYEVALRGEDGQRIDALRYVDSGDKLSQESAKSDELAFVKLRYKTPQGGASRLLTHAVNQSAVDVLDATSVDFRFTAAVAAFAQKLRGGKYLQDYDYPQIRQLATDARGADQGGYRADFLRLVGLAESLQPMQVSQLHETGQQ